MIRVTLGIGAATLEIGDPKELGINSDADLVVCEYLSSKDSQKGKRFIPLAMS